MAILIIILIISLSVITYFFERKRGYCNKKCKNCKRACKNCKNAQK